MDERSRVLMATFLGAVVGWRLGLALHDGERTAGPRPDRAEARRLHERADARARHGREGSLGGQRRLAVVERHGRAARRAAGRHSAGTGARWEICRPRTSRSIIMAVVSVLEALLLIGIGVGGFMVYRRVMQLVTDLEARQIAPLREKVDAILGDVKSVTARVNSEAERVDQRHSRHHRPRRPHGRASEELGDGQGESRGRGRARRARGDRLAAADGSQAEAARYGRGTAVEAGSDGRTRMQEEVAWHTNTIASNGKMAAGRF